MKYYTIFLGNKMWQDTIDDMNTTKIWGVGGRVWNSMEKAKKCIDNLRHPAYDLEDKNKKFSIVELYLTNIKS